MNRREFLRTAGLVGGAAAIGGPSILGFGNSSSAASRAPTLGGPHVPANSILNSPAAECPIDTILVLTMENRSFDHYFGHLATDQLSVLPRPAEPPQQRHLPIHRLQRVCAVHTYPVGVARVVARGAGEVTAREDAVRALTSHRPATERLTRHFQRAYPQLADLAFPFRWGGAIDIGAYEYH